jgi:benzil reductase ((S)-benzoin forming)
MEQKTYLVTGASKGIGHSIAHTLAEEGIQVILLSRQSDELQMACDSVQSISPTSFSVACDLSDSDSINQAIEDLIETSSLDGIVHNAGAIAPIKPMSQADNDEWALNIQINLIGVQRLTKGLYPKMKASQHCRVTTISSGAALRPLHSWSSYCISKAGLDMWSRCLAEEGAKDGITSISIAPGIVNTDMQLQIRSSSVDDFPMVESFSGYHRDGQLTNPDDVARQLHPLIIGHTVEQSGMRFDVRDL